jgi:hypothetical protein
VVFFLSAAACNASAACSASVLRTL